MKPKGFTNDQLSEEISVVEISCVNEEGVSVSKYSINTKYFNSQRPDVLEHTLNRMVDDINESPSSLANRAFRVKEGYLNPTV